MALPNPSMNFTPYDTLTAAELDNLVENIEALADGTGLNDAVITQDKLATGADFATGWNVNALPAVSAVTNNGNRSYTLTHASSVASLVSEGMRRRFTRTVAANTYMGGLMNGSSHYFTKTSPSGTLGTVTNNFTIEAWVQPTSYAAGPFCGRSDATRANSFGLEMTATGAVRAYVFNGGTGNYRYIDTSQSLPLNKKTHVAMSWASGTILIYLDGISVPLNTVATAGTNPTTAGTGGDFSIGRAGAYAANYFPGYISNVAVFDAVLSASTIKEHSTYKLTGSETNCIGAWSLDNTANDQSSAGNNLTATGGVGFSNVSPFGNNGKSSTLEYGLVMDVSSDGLTEVVQVPEGCALPTTGGITASAYSTQANPFGWVSDKGRWEVSFLANTLIGAAYAAINQWKNAPVTFSVPTGKWAVGYQCHIHAASTVAGVRNITFLLASFTPTNTVCNYELSSSYYVGATTGNTDIIVNVSRYAYYSHSSSTTYTPYAQLSSASGVETFNLRGDIGQTKFMALPSGL